MCIGGSSRTFCRIFSSNSNINDEIAAQFYKILIRKLKDKRKLIRVSVFPQQSSRGQDFIINHVSQNYKVYKQQNVF